MNKFLLPLSKKSIIASFFLIFFISLSFSQQNTGEIKGTIKDRQRNESLLGANILVQGTNYGANSDFDGNFLIKNIPAGNYVIIARYVGYKQQAREVTVAAGKTAELNFYMEPTAVQMNEVVVTGQGAAVEKRKLPSAVETISQADIQYSPVKSLDGLLQGRVPGLSAFSTSGIPGTGMRLMTRGIKSARSNTTPVVYIDGVKVDVADNYRQAYSTGGMVSSSLADLVVGDIDHVEVLKGGAASTLYGSEAANGVIQIFTRKGIPGSGRWKFGITSGFDKPELRFTYEDITKDKFYRTSMYQSYSINLAGGTDMINYNLSGKATNNTGIVAKDKLNDDLYSISSGFRAILSEKSNLEVSATYVNNTYGFVFNDNNVFSPVSQLETAGKFINPTSAASLNKDSVLNGLLLPEVTNYVNRFTTAVNLSYSPFAEFNNKFTIGVDYRQSEQRLYAPPEAGAIVVTPGGFQRRSDRQYMILTFGYMGSYKLPDLGSVTQTLSAGAQAFRVEDREKFSRANNYGVPGTTDYDNFVNFLAGEDNRQIFNGGFYLNDQIGLFDRVFLDLGVRFDGNSTFGKDVGLQTYPKAGLAYNISDEVFYPELLKEYLSSLKFRGSWGMTGNFPSPFARDRTYTANTYMSDVGLTFNNPGDPELKPEKVYSYDFGFDAGLFGDKVSFEFTYFNQLTKGALFTYSMDPASGFTSQQKNVGEIENKGIELSLRANLLRTEDFDINIRASYNTLDNKVVTLGGAAPFSIGGYAYLSMWVEEGYPIGLFHVTVPLKEDDGTYRGRYTSEVKMGNPTPTKTGSVGIDITLFKDLSISAFGEFALGHDIVNHLYARRVVSNYPDALQKLYSVYNSTDPNNPYTRNTASIAFVESGDWFKIREISIRYNMPKLLFKGLTLTASIRNVAILGLKAGIDPEVYFDRGGGTTQQLEIGGMSGAGISPPVQVRFGLEVAI